MQIVKRNAPRRTPLKILFVMLLLLLLTSSAGLGSGALTSDPAPALSESPASLNTGITDAQAAADEVLNCSREAEYSDIQERRLYSEQLLALTEYNKMTEKCLDFERMAEVRCGVCVRVVEDSGGFGSISPAPVEEEYPCDCWSEIDASEEPYKSFLRACQVHYRTPSPTITARGDDERTLERIAAEEECEAEEVAARAERRVERGIVR